MIELLVTSAAIAVTLVAVSCSAIAAIDKLPRYESAGGRRGCELVVAATITADDVRAVQQAAAMSVAPATGAVRGGNKTIV